MTATKVVPAGTKYVDLAPQCDLGLEMDLGVGGPPEVYKLGKLDFK